MIKEGSIVRAKDTGKKMVVGFVSQETFVDLTGVVEVGDVTCYFIDKGVIKFRELGENSVEVICETENLQFKAGDIVKLKTGDGRFVVNGVYGNEICLEDSAPSYYSCIFELIK